MKTRQFGDCLAKEIACRTKIDCRESSFDETLKALKSERLVHQNMLSKLYNIKRIGNEAVHEHLGDEESALECLVDAHDLANWFVTFFLNDQEHRILPFQTPTVPEDASVELKQIIEELKYKNVRAELFAKATAQEIDSLKTSYMAKASAYEAELKKQRDANIENEEKINSLKSEADSRLDKLPYEDSEILIRTRVRTQQLSRSSDEENLPFMQLRITTGNISRCCDVPMVLAQAYRTGYVKECCPECNEDTNAENLSKLDFQNLKVYVACPHCQLQTKHYQQKVTPKSYKFKCENNACNSDWECELAQVIPLWKDLEKKEIR